MLVKPQMYFNSISEKKYSSEYFKLNLCRVWMHCVNSELTRVKENKLSPGIFFEVHIMFSGILISVRDHPYSTSAKWCVGGGGQILMKAKSVKGKKDIYFICINSVMQKVEVRR